MPASSGRLSTIGAVDGGIGMDVGLFILLSVWLVILPSSVIAAMMAIDVWHDRRKHRRRPGVCRCGYDLRGNPAGRCPECGRAANFWPLRAD